MSEIIDIMMESAKTSVSKIENCSIHIYSHLMKMVTNDSIHKDWVQTVYEQHRQLKQITNSSYWKVVSNDESKMRDIKNKAMEEYIEDHNTNAEAAFNAVYNGIRGMNNGFSSITKFQDWNALKKFMIFNAEFHGDDEMVEYIENYKS